MAEPGVSQTASIHTEGPKFPWTKGEVLGAGSFATVYRALDRDGVSFAAKEVKKFEGAGGDHSRKALEQLKQDMDLLKTCKHPNIVPYFGTEEKKHKIFIFLEFVEKSLASLYQEHQLTDHQIKKFTTDIMKGLEYLHSRNIIHRDVKCANILVDKKGACKLADFGLAKQISSINKPTSTAGTVPWMAPEVVRSKPYGKAADIWSLGCCVLEMATRVPPFLGEDPVPKLGNIAWRLGQGEAPKIPDHLSDRLREFVKVCTNCEPSDRPTVEQLLEHPFIREDSGVSGPSDPQTLPQPIREDLPSHVSSQPRN